MDCEPAGSANLNDGSTPGPAQPQRRAVNGTSPGLRVRGGGRIRRSRFYRILNLVLLATLAWLPLGLVSQVSAHHPVGFFLAYINTVEDREDFCVETAGSSVPFPEAHNPIRYTLIYDNPSEGYDRLNYDHIYFQDAYWQAYQGCDPMAGPGGDPSIEQVEIRYYIRDTDNLHPLCRGFSCVVEDQFWWSSDAGTGYRYYNVYLKTSAFTSTLQRHLINHETGHVLGLADGGPESPFPNSGCLWSIMHPQYENIPEYGCDGSSPARSPYIPPLDWPTGGDLDRIWRNTLGQP